MPVTRLLMDVPRMWSFSTNDEFRIKTLRSFCESYRKTLFVNQLGPLKRRFVPVSKGQECSWNVTSGPCKFECSQKTIGPSPGAPRTHWLHWREDDQRSISPALMRNENLEESLMSSNVRRWLLIVYRTAAELVDNTLAMECLQYARNGYRNLS
ncbi:hypothetical protein CEXT_430201 [Caerostris extrusa]|uniref:Uncharacterized protein n=1 Tax=Caerostris extrusa TaxID=172846 RepID=A0AAV4XWV7_CAEEX|nr:hypothetical protein CEXT_430201 [Caerostris extrusa]